MNGQSYKILIIDDSAEDRVTFRYELEKNKECRYEFLEAELGDRGIEICRAEHPDCVLLDYNLPDGDGLSVLRAINPDPLDPEFAVVLLTGSGSEVIAVNALKNGAQDYLVKGKITPEDLHLSIQKAVEIVRLRKEKLQALKDLRQSEERLSLAFKGANIGAFDWNIKTGEIQWSSEIEEMTGISADEFDNSFEGFTKLIHPLDRELLEKRIADALRDGEYECEFRMLKGDGTIRWVIGKGRVLFDDDGTPARLVGVDIDITKRKLAEEELRENQHFTQSLIDTVPSMLYICDLKTKTTKYLSEPAAQILGYSSDEVKEAMPNFLASKMHPDDAPAIEKYFQEITRAKNGNIFELEHRMRHKSGEWRWFRSRDRVYKRDENGRAQEILGIASDITTRKRAEDQLRESDRRMRLATEATEVGVWEWNVITDEIRWDAQMFRIYGIEPTENGFVPYTAWSESVLPEELARQEELLQKTLREGGRGTREFRIRRNNDGKIRYVQAVETVRLNDEGQPEWVVGTNLDVTTRRFAEEELRESEARFRRVLAQSNAGIVQTDAAGRMTLVNQRWCEMLGYSEAELLSMSVLEVTHSSSRQVTLDNVGKMAAGGPDFEVEKNYRRKDGSMMSVVSKVSALRGKDGEYQGLVAVVIDMTERLQAEAEIKALSDYNRNVLESITDPLFTLDREYRFTYMSSQGEKLVRREPGELIGKSLWDEFPGLFGTPFEKMYRDAMEEKTFGTVTDYFPDHDRWYEVITYPALNGVTVYFKDTSERKRRELNLAFLADLQADFAPLLTADEILRVAGERIAAYLNLTNCSFVEINEAMDTAHVLHDQHAADAVDLAGVYAIEDFHPAEERAEMLAGRAIVINDTGAMREPEAAARFDALGIRALLTAPYVSDGRWRFCLCAMRDQSGIWLEAEVELLTEIAARLYIRFERTRVESNMRESEERFRSLFDSIDEGFCIIEVIFDENNKPIDYRFVQANPAMERLTGLKDALGKTAREMIPGLEEFWFETYGKVALTGEAVRFENFAEPMNRWFEVYASRLGDSRNRVAIVFNNITERKLSEQEREESFKREQILRREAERANIAKDEFLAVLSHELRSPLNAMLGWAVMLNNGSLNEEMQRQAVGVIERNIRLQNALIEDLLDVSRIISGKMRLERERISFVPVVQNALNTARPAADAKNIKLETEFDSAADEMNGDAHRLQQIIGNLLTNAIKFTPENGTISVRLECADETARLTIKDSGIGIGAELLPHVFERFQQADGSTKRQFGGLGLGLTIVKYLTEMHDGQVFAASEGEGKGSTFTVELPLVKTCQAEESVSAAGNVERHGTSEAKILADVKLLIVDDDADALDLLRFVLEQKGAQAVCAGSVGKALTHLQDDKFDLLISDLGMAGTDGYDLIRQVRASENKDIAALPAIALTGYVSTEDRERVLLAGFQKHLSKPLDIDKLFAVVLDLIEENVKKSV